MKPATMCSTASSTPLPATDAAAYIAQELPKARQALRRSRIIGLVLIGLVGSYISVISLTMIRFFQPQEAARIASGMLIEHIADDGPGLMLQVERQVPLLIRQLPDYVIRQLPVYRRDVELTLETELQGHGTGLSRQLGKQMDELLATHQNDLKILLARPNDRALVRTVLPDLDETVGGFLTTDADGKVVREHINDLAAGLKDIERHMERLANGTNLTPEERKARRSLAVLAKAIKDNTKVVATAGGQVDKLASQ
jgi:hypothetical protein